MIVNDYTHFSISRQEENWLFEITMTMRLACTFSDTTTYACSIIKRKGTVLNEQPN